jgi:hypothetical protein
MTGVFTAPDAQVVVGFLVLIGSLAALWAQNRRTHRDNRSDHAETAQKVNRLLTGQTEIKADVAELHADVRDHGARLRVLEQIPHPEGDSHAS